MDEEKEKYIEVLKIVYRMLDNLKYECCAREYTLDEDQMGNIFYCRDEIWLTLKEFGKEK